MCTGRMQGGDGVGRYSGQQTEEAAIGSKRKMVTTESMIMVVGVGTVVAGRVTQVEETDSDTPTAHMRKFDKTRGGYLRTLRMCCCVVAGAHPFSLNF